MPERQTLRADARRNRMRVLTAAQEAFEAEGVAVPLDEIARRAGVGAGTVYRHFPSKEALFEAVVSHRLDELAQAARDAHAAADAGPAFFDLFTRVVEQAVLNKALCDALFAETGKQMHADSRKKSEFRSTMDALLRRAQDAGAVRKDVDGEDVFAAVIGALTMARHGSGPSGRMIGIVRDGLRAG